MVKLFSRQTAMTEKENLLLYSTSEVIFKNFFKSKIKKFTIKICQFIIHQNISKYIQSKGKNDNFITATTDLFSLVSKLQDEQL